MGQVKTREVKHRVLPLLEKGALALAAVFQPKVELVVSKTPTSQVSLVILYSYVLWLYHLILLEFIICGVMKICFSIIRVTAIRTKVKQTRDQ